jgi:hypothetical protein
VIRSLVGHGFDQFPVGRPLDNHTVEDVLRLVGEEALGCPMTLPAAPTAGARYGISIATSSSFA